jgi:hypothetical protein
MLARTVAAGCESWVKTLPRCWSTCGPASRFSGMCVRAELRCLRPDRAGTGALAAYQSWTRRVRAARACASVEVCPPLAALPAVGDLCPRRRRSRPLDARRMGRWLLPVRYRTTKSFRSPSRSNWGPPSAGAIHIELPSGLVFGFWVTVWQLFPNLIRIHPRLCGVLE